MRTFACGHVTACITYGMISGGSIFKSDHRTTSCLFAYITDGLLLHFSSEQRTSPFVSFGEAMNKVDEPRVFGINRYAHFFMRFAVNGNIQPVVGRRKRRIWL